VVLLLEFERMGLIRIKLLLEFGSMLSVIVFSVVSFPTKVQIAVEGIRHNIWTHVVLFLQKHRFGIGFFRTGLLRIAGVHFGGNR